MTTTVLKHCPSCDSDKGIDEFSSDKSTKDKKRYRCKACDMAWHWANRERLNEAARMRAKALYLRKTRGSNDEQ